MNQPPPPLSAYGDSLTAAAAAAAAGYSAAAPGYGRALAPNAEGLVFSPRDTAVSYGFPAHGSPAFPNDRFHGALPYTSRGLPSTASFHGALPGHPYTSRGLPSTARFDGALPGHAYDAAGLRNQGDAIFHGMIPVYGYAAPGQGQLPIINSGARDVSPVGLNPGARCFEPSDTGVQQRPIHSVPLEDSLQDAAGGLNFGDGSFDGHASRQSGDTLNPRRGRSFDRQDLRLAGGALNPAARPFDLSYNSRQAGGSSHPIVPSATAPLLTGADWRSLDLGAHLPGIHQTSCSSSSSSSNLADPYEEVQVNEIWRDNCLEAFAEIKEIMVNRKGQLYIAMDMEYLAAPSTNISFKPNTPEEWYVSLQEYVNTGAVVQIGLAIASEDLKSEVAVYELNLLVDASNFHQDAVKFLENHNHDLDRHKNCGILPEWVCAGVLRNLPFGTHNAVWLAYHGDRDIAFIVKLLEGGGSQVLLPASLASFLHRVSEQFPLYYDVRVLSQLVKEGFRGKLTTLAGHEFLNLNRTGSEHHAGSDALLTLKCFAKIVQDHKLEAVVARRCLLSGIEELQLPITCYRNVNAADVYVVDVFKSNFDHEAAYICQTISSNFNIIGLQVVAPKDANVVESDYTTLRSAVQEVNFFELSMSFMSSEGNLAYGRAWNFFLEVQDEDPSRVNALKLAALLSFCGATHDENTLWITYGGEYGLACLIRSFIAPGALPISSVRYKLAKTNLFPHVYDMMESAEVCPGLEVAGDLREAALHLGVAMGSCDAVTILRCYRSLRSKLNRDDQS